MEGGVFNHSIRLEQIKIVLWSRPEKPVAQSGSLLQWAESSIAGRRLAAVLLGQAMSVLNITGETDNCDPLRGLIIRELREASIRRREEAAEEEKEEEQRKQVERMEKNKRWREGREERRREEMEQGMTRGGMKSPPSILNEEEIKRNKDCCCCQ